MASTNRTRPWSDLPQEILEKIVKRLETQTDVNRFRAVCTSWRRNAPTFKKPPSLPLIRLPFPINPRDLLRRERQAYFNMIESTVYLLQLPENDGSSSCKGWLVKVGRGDHGKSRILNPLNRNPINNELDADAKELNLLNFRVTEICKSYNLEFVNPRPRSDQKFNSQFVKKVVVAAGPAWTDGNDFSLLVIEKSGKLCCFKNGDKKWTVLYDWDHYYVDVAFHKGQFYAVNRDGRTLVFDSWFNATKFASKLRDCGRGKRLVESNGELLLVDIILDADKKKMVYDKFDDTFSEVRLKHPRYTAVEIKVYKPDKEQRRWVLVNSLEDRILFAGKDCSFSVSAQDFADCMGNCVYYADKGIHLQFEEGKNNYEFEEDDEYDESDDSDEDCDTCESSDDENPEPEDLGITVDLGASIVGGANDVLRGLHGHNIGVCDLETGDLGSLLKLREYASIFWPPPSWLK